MTPRQASRLIGCTPQTVRRLISTGRLIGTKRVLTTDCHGNETYQYDITEAVIRKFQTIRDVEYIFGRPRGTFKGKAS